MVSQVREPVMVFFRSFFLLNGSPENSRIINAVAGLTGQDHVYTTTDESFRFHNKKIDEMRYTENPSSFEKYPTPP